MADSDGLLPGPSHFWTDDGTVLPDFTSVNVDAIFHQCGSLVGAASGGAGQASSSIASTRTVLGIKIHLRLPIQVDCNQIAIYNDLKRDLQELYARTTCLQVHFQGSEQNSGIWALD